MNIQKVFKNIQRKAAIVSEFRCRSKHVFTCFFYCVIIYIVSHTASPELAGE